MDVRNIQPNAHDNDWPGGMGNNVGIRYAWPSNNTACINKVQRTPYHGGDTVVRTCGYRRYYLHRTSYYITPYVYGTLLYITPNAIPYRYYSMVCCMRHTAGVYYA